MEWCPFKPNLFLSCSDDSKVGLWDINRIGGEQKADEVIDGPQELIFTHRGHKGGLADATWHPTAHFYVASVDSEDNLLHVWQMVQIVDGRKVT